MDHSDSPLGPKHVVTGEFRVPSDMVEVNSIPRWLDNRGTGLLWSDGLSDKHPLSMSDSAKAGD